MPVYLFPGQGSQSIGMGRELFDKFPDITAKADTILGYSIKSLCTEALSDKLNQTQYTQPALYTVNALTYFNALQNNAQKPAYVAGHSLGEYNALLAAEVFDFEAGLHMVKKRGELMGKISGGAMAAVIGLSIETIKTILTQHNLTNVAIANHNSHTQIVISGLKEEIHQARILCEQYKASMVIPLSVSGAFHSPLMHTAQTEFESFIKDFLFSPPKLPVIANRTARPYQPEHILQTLVEQITSPVRWTESIDYLLDLGKSEFKEIGPGSVLTGLVGRIKNRR